MENDQTPCLHIRRKCYGQNSRICSLFLKELTKNFGVRKMALAFSTFKKKLYTNYIKKDKEPNWDDLPQVKSYWEEFKQYKLSEEARKKSEQAKVNAANKKYSHHLGVPGTRS